MTIDENASGGILQVPATRGRGPKGGRSSNLKWPDFRATQSLELPFYRLCEPGDPQARLMQERDTAVKGTWQQRVLFLEKRVFVRTPDVSYVLNTIEELLPLAGLVANPGGMRVIAQSGMGKDTLIRYLSEAHPSQPHGARPRFPILFVDFPHRLAPGEILRKLLDQTGCIYKSSDSVRDLETRLLDTMDACQTQGLIFNEAQHLVSAAKGGSRVDARVAGESGDWLKLFLERIKRPVFMFGVPGWDSVFTVEKQLATRIPHRYEILPLPYDKNFVGILQALDQAIPMPEPAGLTDTVLARKLYGVSAGVWRPLVQLLRHGIIFATHRGSPRIGECDLARAYGVVFGQIRNPFRLQLKR